MTQGLIDLARLIEDKFGKERFNPGLERISVYIRKNLNLKLPPNILTIAGTNGKGETTHCLGHVLKKLDYSYAMWTSPHQLFISERMVANGVEISQAELARLINKHLHFCEKENTLSYYEFLFVIFLDWISSLDIDFLLLEVGLGGRLDAVNVVDAKAVLLTSIARDHQEYLGHRLRNILHEKLGVCRAGGFLFSQLETVYLQQYTKAFCHAHKIHWFNADGSKKPNYSEKNRQLALQALSKILHKSLDANLLQDFVYGNNLQWQKNDTFIYGAGAHNPDGMRKLIQLLHQSHYTKFNKVYIAFSKRMDCDIKAMYQMVVQSGLVNEVVVCTFEHPKAMGGKELERILTRKVLIGPDYTDIIEHAIANKESLLICGSYYFLSEFRKHLRQKE